MAFAATRPLSLPQRIWLAIGESYLCILRKSQAFSARGFVGILALALALLCACVYKAFA